MNPPTPQSRLKIELITAFEHGGYDTATAIWAAERALEHIAATESYPAASKMVSQNDGYSRPEGEGR